MDGWVIFAILCALSGFPPLMLFGIFLLLIFFIFRN